MPLRQELNNSTLASFQFTELSTLFHKIYESNEIVLVTSELDEIVHGDSLALQTD